VGGVALLIDAKSERAAAWYRGYGAVALEPQFTYELSPEPVGAGFLTASSARLFRMRESHNPLAASATIVDIAGERGRDRCRSVLVRGNRQPRHDRA
jgi:hypothetical protein